MFKHMLWLHISVVLLQDLILMLDKIIDQMIISGPGMKGCQVLGRETCCCKGWRWLLQQAIVGHTYQENLFNSKHGKRRGKEERGKNDFDQVCRIGLLFPIYSIAYILCPWLSASRIMRNITFTLTQHQSHHWKYLYGRVFKKTHLWDLQACFS